MAVTRKGASNSAPAAAAAAPVSAEEEAGLNVASMNPDEMSAGGLKDDFDGTIKKVRLVPWDYNGNIDHHVLAVAVTIEIDGEDEPFTQHYSAGDLEHFVPSKDGKTPVPLDKDGATEEELEGIYALRVGKRDMLSNSSNWATFVSAALDANFPRAALRPAVSFFEGTVAHFNRVPQKKRSGIVAKPPKEGQQARSNDILVITEVKQAPGGAKVAAPAKPAPTTSTSSTASPAAPAAPVQTGGNGATGDLAARVAAVIGEAAKAAGENGMPKTALAPLMLKSFTGADKAKAVAMAGKTEFLADESRTEFAFDPDTGTIYGV